MNFIKAHHVTFSLLLLALLLSACSPAAATATSTPVVSTLTDIPNTPTEVVPTATTEPSQTPAPQADPVVYPLIWNALSDQHEGPWAFTIPIQR